MVKLFTEIDMIKIINYKIISNKHIANLTYELIMQGPTA